jgi:hypothetical protein
VRGALGGAQGFKRVAVAKKAGAAQEQTNKQTNKQTNGNPKDGR